jgi:ABC-type branched-subunit amino acid transport system permease subunit
LARRANPLQAITINNDVVRIAQYGVRAMKTIVSALVALSVLAGIAGSANALDTKFFALDTKFFWEQQGPQSY